MCVIKHQFLAVSITARDVYRFKNTTTSPCCAPFINIVLLLLILIYSLIRFKMIMIIKCDKPSYDLLPNRNRFPDDCCG